MPVSIRVMFSSCGTTAGPLCVLMLDDRSTILSNPSSLRANIVPGAKKVVGFIKQLHPGPSAVVGRKGVWPAAVRATKTRRARVASLTFIDSSIFVRVIEGFGGVGCSKIVERGLANSVYPPPGQVCSNQEHLLRQINLVGLNRPPTMGDVCSIGDCKFRAPCAKANCDWTGVLRQLTAQARVMGSGLLLSHRRGSWGQVFYCHIERSE